MSRQLPQVLPQPVRMVSSETLLQPLAAASRIWWSVTPLQMQTYTAMAEALRTGMIRPHSNANANGCQFPAGADPEPSRRRPGRLRGR